MTFFCQRRPRLVMPRPFNSLQISASPFPRRELAKISLTIGAATRSISSVGRSFTPSLTLMRL